MEAGKKVPIGGFYTGQIDPPSPRLWRAGGNRITDGRFNYAWDCENRLISAETLTNLPASVPRIKVEFTYDYLSRRVGKAVYSWNSDFWLLTTDSSFLYDSWNLISERFTTDASQTTNSYVWGLDLSGSLQGAGGIGGLLAVVRGTNAYSVAYDANGNVSECLAGDGSIAVHYEYSPFGETIVASGSMADSFAHRFSTKFTDDETSLLYYGYRYYSPSLGRWLGHDPISQPGSIAQSRLSQAVNEFDRKLLLSKPEEMLNRGIISPEVVSQLLRNLPLLAIIISGSNPYEFCDNLPTERTDRDGAFSLPEIVVVGVIIGGVSYAFYKIYNNREKNKDKRGPEDVGGYMVKECKRINSDIAAQAASGPPVPGPSDIKDIITSEGEKEILKRLLDWLLNRKKDTPTPSDGSLPVLP